MPGHMNAWTVIVFLFEFAIFATCLLWTLFPKWYWKTFQSWKATKEPSKAYFLMMRIEGIIGMLIITAIAAAPALIAHFSK